MSKSKTPTKAPSKSLLDQLRARLASIGQPPSAEETAAKLQQAQAEEDELRAAIKEEQRLANRDRDLEPVTQAMEFVEDARNEFAGSVIGLRDAWGKVEEILERAEAARQALEDAAKFAYRLDDPPSNLRSVAVPQSLYLQFSESKQTSPGKARRELCGLRYLRQRIREGGIPQIKAMFPR